MAKPKRIECQYCFKQFQAATGRGKHELSCPKRPKNEPVTARAAINALIVPVGGPPPPPVHAVEAELKDLDAFLDQQWIHQINGAVQHLNRLIHVLEKRRQQLVDLLP